MGQTSSKQARTSRLRFTSFISVIVAAAVGLSAGSSVAGTPLGGTTPAVATVKVIHVDDGDTLIALTADRQKLKVRLANIDAPESSHGRCRPGQPHSDQAGRRLQHLVKGQLVQLHCMDTDRYGRSVCEVIIGNTTASRILVQEGFAWANRGGSGYVRDREVFALEAQARAAQAGLWKDKDPTPPWVWRRTEWMQPQQGCGGKRDDA